MKKQTRYIIFMLLISACGRHDSSNFGYMANGDVSNGLQATTPEGKLKTAMDTANFSVFQSLLASGADVNGRLPETKNATPLIYSAVKNLPQFTYALLQRDADKTLTDDDGKTAFEKAVDIGNRDRVLMLLDPERQAQGRIEMMEAVIKKRVPKLEALLNAGVDPNFIDEESGETPLTRSVLLVKGVHITKFIAEWKDPQLGISATDIDFPNREGLTPLGFALAHDVKDVADVLKSLNAKESL